MRLLGDIDGWFPAPPDGSTAAWYFGAMVLAVIVIGIAKAGFGGGIGILAVPLVANAMPPDRAIGVMLPILIAADVVSNAHHFRKWSTPHLRWLLSGAFVGIAVGTVVLWWLRESAALQTLLSVLVGGICLAMVALQCWRLFGGQVRRLPQGAWPGWATGAIAGVASTLAHSAGPIASIYLLEERLDKTKHVGTMVLFFFVVNLAKLPTYIGLAYITADTALESAWFFPIIPIGTLLGVWLHHRIPEKPFVATVYVGAALAAAHLVWKSVAAAGAE